MTLRYDNAPNDIDAFIKKGLKDLTTSLKLRAYKEKENYYSKFKIALKKDNIKSVLKPISINKKYRKFTGATTDKNHGAYGPTGANAMDSGLGSGGVMGGGFGIDSFGITAFGEAINKTKSKYLEFVNSLNETNQYVDSDTMESVVSAYKVLFDSIEAKSNVILCGIQPSLFNFFGFSLDKLVFALNTFNGNIISLYIGGHESIENIDTIKQWYLDIGVNQEVVNNIEFIEKSSQIPKSSAFDYQLVTSEYGINSTEALNELCELIDNPIILGCADVYFMAEIILEYTKLHKHVDIDSNFIFTV